MGKFIAAHRILDHTRALDFIAPLLLRLYLAPVFWMAGTRKLGSMDSTIAWFADPDWGLGLPFPAVMAWTAALSETIGAVLLVAGLAVRWATVPLMVTMAVAALTVHWQNGWLVIAEGGSDAARRLNGFMEWLAGAHPGRYEYITELGSPVVLNNGIEFAATYFIMLLTLFFIGGGRLVSIDYWLCRRFMWLKKAGDSPC